MLCSCTYLVLYDFNMPFTLKTQDNNDILAYWLSNASTLLLLLQRTLKAGGAAGAAPQHRRAPSATLFGRMTQVKHDAVWIFNQVYTFS